MPEPINAAPKDIETVKVILAQIVPEYEVRVFGSRVAGKAKEYSDLDLAVMTNRPLAIDRLAQLREAFNESDLPFTVDLADWASISEAFRKIILSQSVIIQLGK